MDTVSPETRSRIMSAIRGTDTLPERMLRSALFARGYRFRINCRDLPGRPDLKLTKHRVVILVHGCFWHGHDCRYFRMPSSNSAFWAEKFRKNRERDARNVIDLRKMGWRVCVVWECAVRRVTPGDDPAKVVDALCRWMEGRRPFLELFDAEAVASKAVGEERPRRTRVGRNADAGLFAAERSPGYGRK